MFVGVDAASTGIAPAVSWRVTAGVSEKSRESCSSIYDSFFRRVDKADAAKLKSWAELLGVVYGRTSIDAAAKMLVTSLDRPT